jgi:hypothetical protein
MFITEKCHSAKLMSEHKGNLKNEDDEVDTVKHIKQPKTQPQIDFSSLPNCPKIFFIEKTATASTNLLHSNK